MPHAARAAQLVSIVCVALPAAASPATLAPVVVQDLYYGEVLFQYFQDNYFTALTHLRAAQAQERINHHAEEAELLLGGLYLSYGQHQEAGRIFERLLARNVAPAVRDRAWFYLGKVWYQRGYWAQAERALREVGRAGDSPGGPAHLSLALQSERLHLLAQVLIQQERYEEAIALLRGAAGLPDWSAYAQFNLGVALVRAGRFADGVQMLDAVGRLDTTDAELLALRDKANVALGYAYLQNERAADAIPVLERVRLAGPQSNKALLAFGWARAAQSRYEEALVPWMELRGRNLLDAAVQESYLAIPFAFGRLQADAQAVEHYNAAVSAYTEESARIDQSIEGIRTGGLFAGLAAGTDEDAQGWFWQLKTLPTAPESRYLYHLLAGHEFQEGLKNLRDLNFMRANLTEWLRSVEVFDDMLETQRLAYEARVPRVNAVLAGENPDERAARRVELESRLNAAERSEDFLALGTAEEQAMWASITRLEETAAGSADEELRGKLRLLKGVLYWQMNQDLKARQWTTRRSLKELDSALREMQQRWLRVHRARRDTPQRNAAFAARVAALEERLVALEAQLAQLGQAQQEYLAQTAIAELTRQKQRLASYQLEARYALARMYDHAAAEAPPPGGPR